jgi:putative sporulation protein YtaF
MVRNHMAGAIIVPMSYARLFSVLLLALASNLDNVGVGVAYGLRRIRVSLASNLLIGVITATGTLISMLLGRTIGSLLNQNIATLMAGGILIVMGFWVLIREALSMHDKLGFQQPLSAKVTGAWPSGFGRVFTIRKDPLTADGDFSGHIDTREALLLGLALTPNNLVNGAAAGMMNLNAALTAGLVFLISLATISIGTEAGHQCGRRWLGNVAGMVSGALLVLIGTCEIVV